MIPSYDSKLFSALADVKRSISFWEEYLGYVKDGMLEFDERAEYYIECLGRRVDYLADLSFLSHIEKSEKTIRGGGGKQRRRRRRRRHRRGKSTSAKASTSSSLWIRNGNNTETSTTVISGATVGLGSQKPAVAGKQLGITGYLCQLGWPLER